MSKISSLDESEVSWIAYYNVVDYVDTIDSIDITDLNYRNAYNNSPENKIFDNAIQFKYQGGTRDVIIRASDNGWITAHMLRLNSTETLNLSTNNYSNSKLDGIYDIVDWSNIGNIADAEKNVLERSIYDCLKGLDSWSSDIKDNYNPSDVGLYNYEYNTENVSVFSNKKDGYSVSTSNRPQSYDDSFAYTNDTLVYEAYFLGIIHGDDSWNSRTERGIVWFNDTEFSDSSNEDTKYIACDINETVSNGDTINIRGKIGAGYTISKGVAFVLWE